MIAKKGFLTVSCVVFMALTGCTRLSADDQALLTETRAMAEAAKNAAVQAALDARAARDDANKAAKTAEEAAEKADRIFRQEQTK